MAETAAPTTTTPASTGRDASTTANNIAKGISDRVAGRSQNQAPVRDTKGSPPPAKDTNIDKTAPATPPDPNAGKEKFIVEGREVWLTPEQSKAYVQKGLAFEPRMDEFARLRQETVQFQRALLQDPGKILSNMAKQANVPLKDLVQKVLKGSASDDVKEVVGQWYYEDVVEPLRLSPEELKAREDRKWRQEREFKDKTDAEQKIILENQARASRAYNEIRSGIGEAMKESGLADINTPLGAEMSRMVADAMRVAHFQRRVITPKEAITFVRQRLKLVQSSFYDSLDGAALVAELGPTNAEKVKQHFLNLVIPQPGQQRQMVQGIKPTGRKGERKTYNMDDFHDSLAELKKQG